MRVKSFLKNAKYYCIIAAILSIAAGSFLRHSLLYAQTDDQSPPPADSNEPTVRLDVEELRSTPVRFQNYNRRRASQFMRVLDRQLGEDLATGVVNTKVFLKRGVSVQRIFDPAKPGLGADIMSVDRGTNFRHINRLQRIVASYLTTAFAFPARDANTISRFVLYYNARRRGDADTLKERYSPSVVSSVDPQKVGIDRSYRNWSGKTELLFPLRKSLVRPQGKDLSLKELRKEAASAPLREQKEFRQADLRRNRDEAEKLRQKPEQLEAERKRLEEQNRRLEEERARLEQQKSTLDKRLSQLKKNPTKNTRAIQAAEKEQKQIQQKQKQAVQKAKEIDTRKKDIAQKQNDVARQQEEVRQDARELAALNKDKDKGGEVRRLKKENERLKSEQNKQRSANVVQDKILFMRVLRYTSKGHYQNELWYLDAARDDALFRSSYTSICSRDFAVLRNNGGVVVTGYTGDVDSQTDHHLVLLDSDKLNKVRQGKAYVHWRTPIIVRDNKLYAFEQQDETYYLARFSLDLSREARSKDSINPYADITFYKNKIYLTGKSNNKQGTTIHIFKLSDLSTLKIIQPDRLSLTTPTKDTFPHSRRVKVTSK